MSDSKFVHIIYSPCTGVGLNNGFKGQEWFRERIEIFKKYTLQSLLNQTNKNFIHWISFRQEEFKNPLVKELSEYLDSKSYSYIFTFNGLIYHDDKFGGGINLIKNLGRVVRGWKRAKKVNLSEAREVFKNKNKTLPKRLEESLFEIEYALSQKEKQVSGIFLTRIDTDDMFHKDAIAEIQRVKPFEGALVYNDGFIYNDLTGELCEWRPKTNPPFHTIIFGAEDFFDPQKHLAYMKGYKSHEDVTKKFKHMNMPNGRYCVLVHNPGNHISTTWDHPFKGPQIIEQKQAVLKDFGVSLETIKN